jgi:DNA-binding cell septation regulator SpoVG
MSNPYLAKLEVTRITPVNSGGNIKAFASVKLGNTLTIHSVKVIQQTGQKAFVRLPDQKSGEKWFPVVEWLDQAFMDAVSEKVLAAWQGETAVAGQNGGVRW